MNKITFYLNNLGIINALGATKEEVATNLLNISNDPNQSKMVVYDGLFSGRKTYIGKVAAPLHNIPERLAKFNCRNNQLLATAYVSIEADIEQLKRKYGSHRIAIILGTSTSGIAASETAFKQYFANNRFPTTFDYAQQETGSCAEFLAQYAGLTGINYTISTACSSSAKSFIAAERLISAGHCDAAIVGGSDSLCELTLNGFDSLDLLSSSICNPFSINRNGLNIGEGAALFVLSKEPAPIKLAGVGAASDGYHMTAPDPLGSGAKLAIRQALHSAHIAPEAVDYINLHGTGTTKNDAMEALAIHEIFGKNSNAYCSSTKPLLGHTLGVAGAHGVGLCWLLLTEKYNPQRLLPLQLWDNQPDSALPPINLITHQPTKWHKPYFMSNSFAFGGSNVCLIISL